MKKHIDRQTIIDEISKNNCYKSEYAKHLNISLYTFNALLKRYKIDISLYNWKGKKQKEEINKQWFIDNWINTTKSLNQLSKEFNISLSILENRALRYGLKKKYKYQINEKKLFDIQDSNMYYIAGLLNTDGYFRKDTDGFNLQLVGDSEYKLLEKIREYLELTCPIYKMGNRSILSVNYTGVNEHFKRAFNIDVKNKTFNTSVPKSFPNEECARAYVRGCLDGDGYIGSNKPRFTLLTASEKLVYGIKDIIKCYTKVDISVRYERRKTRNYPCIAVQGRNAIEVLDWVYGGNNFLTLERKYSRYKEYKLKR